MSEAVKPRTSTSTHDVKYVVVSVEKHRDEIINCCLTYIILLPARKRAG